jgi:aconitase A
MGLSGSRLRGGGEAHRDAHYRRPRHREDPQDAQGRRQTYAYYSIAAAEEAGLGDFSKLPAALKVVLENMLRFEDGKTVMSTTSRRFPTGPRRAARTRARSPIARRAC